MEPSNPKDHWDNEYRHGSPHFHALASSEPSRAAMRFVDYLEEKRIPLTGRVLEPGCGMGRNTNWLAWMGLEVTGMDFSEVALGTAHLRAKETGANTNYVMGSIAEPWPFSSNAFDFTLDFVTLHLLTSKEAMDYRNEATCCLKSGGRLFVYTLDRSVDQEARDLLRSHPGPEPNTYLLPEINHIERTYTLPELVHQFDPLDLEHAELIRRETSFKDKIFERYYWWAVFRK